MINCVINKTYFYKYSPNQDNKISYPVPRNSSNSIQQNEKKIKKEKNEYLKDNANIKQSNEITTSSYQNTKVNNKMKKRNPHYKSNKNLLISKESIIKNILGHDLKFNNENNLRSFSPKTIRNIKLSQKNSLILNRIDEPLLILKFKYFDHEDEINIYYDDDGLIISEKINSIFHLNLKKDELQKLGLLITSEINNIIEVRNKNNSINNFGCIIDLSNLIKNSRKKKITMKFNGKSYYYFINNCIEDINLIVDDIFKKVNKFNQYNQKDLKQEITLSIIGMIKNT